MKEFTAWYFGRDFLKSKEVKVQRTFKFPADYETNKAACAETLRVIRKALKWQNQFYDEIFYRFLQGSELPFYEESKKFAHSSLDTIDTFSELINRHEFIRTLLAVERVLGERLEALEYERL